jgi:hypothetical protein
MAPDYCSINFGTPRTNAPTIWSDSGGLVGVHVAQHNPDGSQVFGYSSLPSVVYRY